MFMGEIFNEIENILLACVPEVCYISCFWAKTLYYPYGFFGLVWFSLYMYQYFPSYEAIVNFYGDHNHSIYCT